MDFGCGYGVEAKALREMLDEVGITSLAAHVTPLDADNVASVIAYHKQIGTRYIVSKGVPDSGETLLSMSTMLARVGEQIHSAGMIHLLHPGLIRGDDERTDLDDVLDRVDEDLIGIKLDTYWTHRSGLDPNSVMRRYGTRIQLLHQKDIPTNIDQPTNIVGALDDSVPLDMDTYAHLMPDYFAPDNFIEVGRGSLPIQQYIDTATFIRRRPIS